MSERFLHAAHEHLEAFHFACDEARQEIIDLWENASDQAQREALWHQLQALAQVRDRLQAWANEAQRRARTAT